ncbi:hypothetical protein HEP84_38025 [Streptomyces sp. RLB1-33]|nr:hypothetical protein [Streptomyces sp. RLB1-33]QIY74086.1 hypothetical protein HEP84_38025 [Streptomyces sp. RLB1-33]
MTAAHQQRASGEAQFPCQGTESARSTTVAVDAQLTEDQEARRVAPHHADTQHPRGVGDVPAAPGAPQRRTARRLVAVAGAHVDGSAARGVVQGPADPVTVGLGDGDGDGDGQAGAEVGVPADREVVDTRLLHEARHQFEVGLAQPERRHRGA